jgi:hypothetical protein
MYQPRISTWLTLFKSIEWQIFFLCVFVSGILGILFGRYSGWMLLPGVAGLLMAGISALHNGMEASRIRQDQWTGTQQVKGVILIAMLHLLQPWARFRGRIAGAVHLSSSRRAFPEDQRLWGNIGQRDQWIRLLWKHLHACGWVCEASGEWADSDLIVKGPGFYEIRITSVYEEILHRGFHWVRYRLEATAKSGYYAGVLLVILSAAFIAFRPSLLPMVLPVGFLAWLLLRSRRHMLNAISQAALECGTALDMPEVQPEYQK